MVRCNVNAEQRGFMRMETDGELLARMAAVCGMTVMPRPDETLDQRAERCGLQRRIVNGVP